MNFPWQKTTWEGAIKANIALSFAVLILSVFSGYALYMATTANDRERIILMPPVVDKTMMIGWDSANEDYLKSFGLYVATLIGNISQANAKFVADSVSQFISPSVYSEVRKTILSAAESRQFKEAAASTKYTPTGVSYEAETRKVFVVGTMDMLNAGMNNQTQPIVYEMEIRIVGGKPSVLKLSSYSDSSAHTQKWLTEHQSPKPVEEHN
jgi:conjugal transfer pilus assembly protein TraE